MAKSMASAKPLGIFWDIDNCPIPLTISAAGAVNRLRDFISQRHPECGYAKDFFVATDTKRMPDKITDSLNHNGVVILHVSATAKNAADDILQERIDNFVDNFAEKSPILVVITGDINFAKAIRNARKKEVVVVLIFGEHCSQDLRNCANESYSFVKIIDGVEDEANSSDEPKTINLKVLDLPKEKPIKEIKKTLTRLLDNCGGKVVNYCDGCALVRFGCQDDLIRAYRRFNGHMIYEETPLILQPIPEPLNESTLLKEFNICKSIIRGMDVICGQNPKDLVIKTINEWNDSQINGEVVTKVESLDDDCLVVTAITPNANQELVRSAQKYLSPESNIQWTDAEVYESIVGLTQGWCAKSPAEQVSDDRRSVIKGLSTRIGQNVTKLVKDLVDSWNDSQLSGSLILSVQRNTKNTESEGPSNLFVTAVSVEASKALVKGAKCHISRDSALKWSPYKHKFQSSEDCKSVIKGLDISGVQNITHFVKNIVNKWSDPRIKAEFIVSVERNTNQSRSVSDSKCNLFVTATTPQTSRALIKGAKHYIKPEHNVRWTAYEQKTVFRNKFCSIRGDSDSDESQCSFFSTTSSTSVMSSATNSSHTHRSSKRNLNNENRVTNSPVANNSKSNESVVNNLLAKKPNDSVNPSVANLTVVTKPMVIPVNITSTVNHSADNNSFKPLVDSKAVVNNRRSIITGLFTLKTENVLKTVRKIVSDWREKNINGNMIENVDRDPNLAGTDGIVPLFVTTYTYEQTPQLVRAAKMCFDSRSGINWIEFAPEKQSAQNTNASRPPLLPYPPFPPNYNPIISPFVVNYRPFPPQLHPMAQLVSPYIQQIQPIATKAFPFLPRAQPFHSVVSSTQNNTKPPKPSEPKAQTSQGLPKSDSDSKASLERLAKFLCRPAESLPTKGKPSKNSPQSLSRAPKPKTTLSYISGLKLGKNEEPIRTVRRMVSQWKGSICNGNFIAAVEREKTANGPILRVWTFTSTGTTLLLTDAKRFLTPGVSWTHSAPIPLLKNNEQSKAPTAHKVEEPKALVAANDPNKMLVIQGQKSGSNEDVLILVRKLVADMFSGKVSAEDVVNVSRDCKLRGTDGPAVLFVTVANPKVKRLILELAKGPELKSGLQFEDYNGFKH